MSFSPDPWAKLSSLLRVLLENIYFFVHYDLQTQIKYIRQIYQKK